MLLVTQGVFRALMPFHRGQEGGVVPVEGGGPSGEMAEDIGRPEETAEDIAGGIAEDIGPSGETAEDIAGGMAEDIDRLGRMVGVGGSATGVVEAGGAGGIPMLAVMTVQCGILTYAMNRVHF